MPSGGWRLRRMCDCLRKSYASFFSRRFPFSAPRQHHSLSSVALAKPLPKVFVTGSCRAVFGPKTAPFLVRFGAVSDRCAAVFRRFEGSLRGFVLGLLKPVLWSCVQGRALPKHSLLTIPCHPNRRGRHSGRWPAQYLYGLNML